MINKIISKFFSKTYYVVIEDKNIHIRCIEKDISKSIEAKIAIKDNRVYFRFHLLFHINKNLNRELYESEKYLLKSLAKREGAIDFGITKGELLSDDEVLKFNFEEVENI